MRTAEDVSLQRGWRQTFSSKMLGGSLGIGILLHAVSFAPAKAYGDDLENWLEQEEKVASSRLLDATIEGADGHLTFVASSDPSQPSYNFHWVRDAAAVMRSVLYLYQSQRNPEVRNKYIRYFEDYVDFSRKIQIASNPSGGVGEPKFHPDGTPFVGDWARPQNDGPASRAIVMISWAQFLLREGKDDFVKNKLYDSALPTQSIIKTDLEYVSHHWRRPSYDLWEESKGKHFYTLMMERRALLDGARLAQDLGDPLAAAWYSQQAKSMEADIELFWDRTRNILTPSRDIEWIPETRGSGLDSSIILAVLLGHTDDGFMGFQDERVLSTVIALENSFQSLYGINQNPNIPGIGIGRYPEDRYDGYTTNGLGNPWVPMTATFAQFYERLAFHLEKVGTFVVTDLSKPFFDKVLRSIGQQPAQTGVYDAGTPIFRSMMRGLRACSRGYLARIAYHAGAEGELSEQFNRDTGYLQGAQHLAASYATVLWAIWSRRGDFPNPQQPSNP